MAPLGHSAWSWLAPGTISLELFWLGVFLFITIALLGLCTNCNRRTFQIEEKSEKVKTPPQLIKVVTIQEDTGTKEGLWHENIITHLKEGELSGISNETLDFKPADNISNDETFSKSKLVPESHGTTSLGKTPHMDVKSALQRASVQEQHTSKTVQELCIIEPEPSVPAGESPEDRFEDPDYQTVEDLTSYSTVKNHLSDDERRDEPVIISPKAEDLDGRGLYDTYAQISKKIRFSTAPVQLPTEEEEEEPAPPIPEKSVEMERSDRIIE